jgi:hypothetical protein
MYVHLDVSRSVRYPFAGLIHANQRYADPIPQSAGLYFNLNQLIASGLESGPDGINTGPLGVGRCDLGPAHVQLVHHQSQGHQFLAYPLQAIRGAHVINRARFTDSGGEDGMSGGNVDREKGGGSRTGNYSSEF